MRRTLWLLVCLVTVNCGGRSVIEELRSGGSSGGAVNELAGGAGNGNAGGAGASGHAGAEVAQGNAGTATTGGGQGAWQTGVSFDELSLEGLVDVPVVSFAVDAAGNIYFVSQLVNGADFSLTRLNVDGRVAWTQRISGSSTALVVDDAGTIFLSRILNSMGFVDERTAGGDWVWSSPLNDAPAMLTAQLGRDGAVYAGASPGDYLWKLDREGHTLWSWQGGGKGPIVSLGAAANGTAVLRTGVAPDVPLPVPSKGDAPPDGLLLTFDPAGVESAQRRFMTARDYTQTGPLNFVVTSEGLLLSSASGSANVFDLAGNSLWQRSLSDFEAQAEDGLSGVLSQGGCHFCFSSSRALYAFDVDGNHTGTLQVSDQAEYAWSWAADGQDHVYALVGSAPTTTLRRYGPAAWSH